MGILPDWLGEGGFIAVAANPPVGLQSPRYAKNPVSATRLAFAAVLGSPARPPTVCYVTGARPVEAKAAYIVQDQLQSAPVNVMLSAPGYPYTVSNLSYL